GRRAPGERNEADQSEERSHRAPPAASLVALQTPSQGRTRSQSGLASRGSKFHSDQSRNKYGGHPGKLRPSASYSAQRARAAGTPCRIQSRVSSCVIGRATWFGETIATVRP